MSERVDNLDLGTEVLENTARNEEFIQKKKSSRNIHGNILDFLAEYKAKETLLKLQMNKYMSGFMSRPSKKQT